MHLYVCLYNVCVCAGGVLEVLKENGWSAGCVSFGAGASLLQRVCVCVCVSVFT